LPWKSFWDVNEQVVEDDIAFGEGACFVYSWIFLFSMMDTRYHGLFIALLLKHTLGRIAFLITKFGRIVFHFNLTIAVLKSKEMIEH
jgi:hypothetical protein